MNVLKKGFFTLVTTSFALGFIFGGGAVAAIESEKKPLVFVTPVVSSHFSDTVQYPARVRSTINAWMSAESPGQVQKILKSVGTRVTKDDVVLVIQNIDPVYRYAPVEIIAPANGYITSMNVDLLSRVDRGDKLFSVTDPRDLLVETEIPAADLHYFKIGDKGLLRGQDGSEFHLQIYALSPAVDIRTGTATALLHFAAQDKKEKAISQGQLGQLSFQVNSRKSFILPESALISRGGRTFVRVVEKNHAKLIPVTVNLDLGDKIEVRKGLKDGEKVITRWSRFIGDDDEVEVESPEKSSETPH